MADTDPLSAALNMNFNANGRNGSYFPGAKLYADDRSDLNDMLNQTPETGFLSKPSGTPTPAPSPTPTKPSAMNLAQLYQHFGVESRPPIAQVAQPIMPSHDQLEQMRAQYGWNT